MLHDGLDIVHREFMLRHITEVSPVVLLSVSQIGAVSSKCSSFLSPCPPNCIVDTTPEKRVSRRVVYAWRSSRSRLSRMEVKLYNKNVAERSVVDIGDAQNTYTAFHVTIDAVY